jgi:hypothetical protein
MHSPLLTRAEATQYAETSRHAEVIAFAEALCAESPLVRLVEMGESAEGQRMIALVLSATGAFTPEEVHAGKQIVVMIEANIHAGEVEGKEASLALCRDLVTSTKGRRLLQDVAIVVVPDVNPDGNDRISPLNRALSIATLEGQENPPGGVGTRYTGEGWNMNRDAIKQEAVETRNLARLYQAWSPQMFIDCHTTDGSLTGHDLTFDTSHNNQALLAPVLGATRKMLEKLANKIADEQGFVSGWYGNFVVEDDPEQGWMTYPALPRFGSHYRGLLGRMDVLLETYSYIPFQRRCAVIYAWLHGLVRYAGRHRKALKATVAHQAAVIQSALSGGDPRMRVGIQYGEPRRDADGALRFEYPAYALDGDTVEVPSFDRQSLQARRYPGEETQTYTVPHRRSFVPVLSVRPPVAYILDVNLAARLAAHGLKMETLDAPLEGLVETDTVLSVEKTHSPDVAGLVPGPGGGELPLSAKPPPRRFETVLTVSSASAPTTLPAGTHLARVDQPGGLLLVYLLEPCADDGFARWELFDAHLFVGSPFPIRRLRSPLPAGRFRAE